MPDRFSAITEQFIFMSAMLLGAISSLMAAANICLGIVFDPFAGEAVTGNAALLTMVAGSLGGAFISTQANRAEAYRDLGQWSRRVVYATLVSCLFTPFVVRLYAMVDFDWHGVHIQLVPNAATILMFSSLVAISSKTIIKRFQNKFFPCEDGEREEEREDSKTP